LKICFPFRYFFSKDKQLSIKIKNLIGCYPHNISIYIQALRHKSVAVEKHNGIRVSNERLEYLGDAVLDLVVADFMFHKYPYKDEGFLTLMRSKIVSRASLNKLAQKIGLDKYIELDKDSSNVYRSANGDAFEAFLGALYIDLGYKKTKKIIINRILKCHIDIEELENKEFNFKSKLLEWSQKSHKNIEYKCVGTSGNGYLKHYLVNVIIDDKIVGSGKGHTIKEAEQIAAENAWASFE